MQLKANVPGEVKDKLFFLALTNKNTIGNKTLSNLIRDKIYEVVGYFNQFNDKQTQISVEIDDELETYSKIPLRGALYIAIYLLLHENVIVQDVPPQIRTVTIVLRKSEAEKLRERYGSVNRAMNLCLKQLPEPLEEDISQDDPERYTTSIKVPYSIYMKLRQKHHVFNYFIRRCVHQLLGD